MNHRCGTPMEVRKRKSLYGLVRVCWWCPQCKRAQIRFGRNRDVDLTTLQWVPIVHRRRPTKRKRDYAAYLRSKVWRELRKRVLERDGYRCQLGYPVCTDVATEVHHNAYDHFGLGGDQEAMDCSAACRECNTREREERIARGVLG